MSPLLPTVGYMPLDALSPEEEVSVSTVAATAVATGHHIFKIEGYSRLKAMDGENGSYIESSAFKVGGHNTWTIRCYLNGYTKEDAGYVSLFLYAGTVVHAEFELALVSHHLAAAGCTTPPPANGDHQDTLMSKTSQGVRAFRGKKDKDKQVYSSWGCPRFISVKELEEGFLRDDCFAVRCTVTVVKKIRKCLAVVEEKAVVQADDLAARLGMMLCKCDDDMCKRHHARPAAAAAETFLERFANFCYTICRGSPV